MSGGSETGFVGLSLPPFPTYTHFALFARVLLITDIPTFLPPPRSHTLHTHLHTSPSSLTHTTHTPSHFPLLAHTHYTHTFTLPPPRSHTLHTHTQQMKTWSVALCLCLNVGVDPPDVVKTNPCARKECWIGKFSPPLPPTLTPSPTHTHTRPSINESPEGHRTNRH